MHSAIEIEILFGYIGIMAKHMAEASLVRLISWRLDGKEKPMKRGIYRRYLPLLILVLTACGGRSYLNVAYQLPETYKGLPDHPIFLEVTDQRLEQEMFTPKAKEAFRHFTGLFSLEVVNANGDSQMAGAYDMAGLFEAALRERLTRQGITLLDAPRADASRLAVSVEVFRLDLVNHKWLADVGYAVALRKPSGTLIKEKIRGKAERVKLMGKGAIEKVIGEIFSDSINRLNLKRLLDPGHK
jgi:hypothetical protein